MIIKTSEIYEEVRINLNKLNDCRNLAECEKASRNLTRLAKELRRRSDDSRWMEELVRYGF